MAARGKGSLGLLVLGVVLLAGGILGFLYAQDVLGTCGGFGAFRKTFEPGFADACARAQLLEVAAPVGGMVGLALTLVGAVRVGRA